MHLNLYNIKTLFVKGFTFFKDGHSNAYIGKDIKTNILKYMNEETKEKVKTDDALFEEVIHTYVLNGYFGGASPHDFNHEYDRFCDMKNKNTNIIIDTSMKPFFK